MASLVLLVYDNGFCAMLSILSQQIMLSIVSPYHLMNRKLVLRLNYLLFLLFGFCISGVGSDGRFTEQSLLPDISQANRLKRSISLLKSATETYHPEVRIMIYGQSHSLGEWPEYLISNIKKLYPHATIVWTNKAIVAFSSMLLSRSVKTDVVPWQPDLLFLHCLGDDQEDYHRLYSTITKYCTADVVVQGDHVNTAGGVYESLDITEIGPDTKAVLRNYHWLPEIVNKYNLCWADIRTPWKEYILTNNINYIELLRDGFHCNDRGHHLTADLLTRYLVPRSDIESLDAFNNSKIQTLELPKEPNLGNTRLPVRIKGNRVDVIYDEVLSADVPEYEYTLDTKKPEDIASLYDFDRASPTWGLPWPGILGADHVTMPNEERWTIHTKSISLATGQVFFSVEGSKTGEDGEGSNFFFPFVSNSGRLKIEPQAFMQGLAFMYSQQEPPSDWKITVDCVLRAVRSFKPRPRIEKSMERIETLFLSADDQVHELDIRPKAGIVTGIKALRVFSPSGQASIESLVPPAVKGVTAEIRGEQLVLSWPEVLGSERLQTTTHLGQPTKWSSVGSKPILKNNRFEVLLPIGSIDSAFYRISQ